LLPIRGNNMSTPSSQSLAPRLIPMANLAGSVRQEPVAPKSRRVSSRTLLGGDSSLVIDHEGVSYVLRATRLGKLILTK
jgi:hemin uptake protein HemP